MKKKPSTKPATKKSAKKKNRARGKKSEKSAAEVRKDLARLVKEHAAMMTKKVIEEGEKGQVAPVKYLLEMAHIFPEATDGSEATREEDCLAKTLLDRLNVPDHPVVADQQDDEDGAVIPAKMGEEKNSEPETVESGKEEVLV